MAISSRQSSLVQPFCESCVHFDFIHSSVHMTQRLVIHSCPTLSLLQLPKFVILWTWIDFFLFFSHFTAPTPPQIFQITSVMTTSLSFSWQTPMTLNGVLTGYQLSCQPLLSGIPLPQILTPGPTAVMAMLSSLYPGVGYNCSIAARNYAGPSDPVYRNGSTLETGTYADVHKLLCTTDLQVPWPSTSHQRIHS